ncbi:hypothetical protein F8M41_001561 [Gigaspora margarita]|uniref:Uncharacterized protein n=1 Tax=Gigaspora margarita TaxID=4874 RepID=A0A8H3XFS2_GIGMA|nr:hypothetical protein F8M41_001561 [Gigaspora margarita]
MCDFESIYRDIEECSSSRESNQDNFIAKKVKDALENALENAQLLLDENDNDYGNDNYSDDSRTPKYIERDILGSYDSNKENDNYDNSNTNISNNNKNIDDDNESINNDNDNNNTNIEPKQTSTQDSNLISYIVIDIISHRTCLFTEVPNVVH